MPKRPDRFVTGHRGKGQVVYSRDSIGVESWPSLEPMTLAEVKQFQADTSQRGQSTMVIYELVERK